MPLLLINSFREGEAPAEPADRLTDKLRRTLLALN